MPEKQFKVVVDLSKPKSERESYVELTAEELEQQEIDTAEGMAERLAEKKAQYDRDTAKESATEKLAALGLTAEEILAITGA